MPFQTQELPYETQVVETRQDGDDAPPFHNNNHYLIDPDRAYQTAKNVLNTPIEGETEEEFLTRLKNALHDEFPFIEKDIPQYTNRYYDVTGSIFILHASHKEYMILYKFEQAVKQDSKGFFKNLTDTTSTGIIQNGLGYSGRYPKTAFRTVPIIGEQISITEDGTTHIHPPGSRAYLEPGHAKFYRSGWILECAHGNLLVAAPRVIWENSLHDIFGQLGSLWRGLRVNARNYISPNSSSEEESPSVAIRTERVRRSASENNNRFSKKTLAIAVTIAGMLCVSAGVALTLTGVFAPLGVGMMGLGITAAVSTVTGFGLGAAFYCITRKLKEWFSGGSSAAGNRVVAPPKQDQAHDNIDFGAGTYANIMQYASAATHQGNQFTAAASEPYPGDVLTPRSKRFGMSDNAVGDIKADFETNGLGY